MWQPHRPRPQSILLLRRGCTQSAPLREDFLCCFLSRAEIIHRRSWSRSLSYLRQYVSREGEGVISKRPSPSNLPSKQWQPVLASYSHAWQHQEPRVPEKRTSQLLARVTRTPRPTLPYLSSCLSNGRSSIVDSFDGGPAGLVVRVYAKGHVLTRPPETELL